VKSSDMLRQPQVGAKRPKSKTSRVEFRGAPRLRQRHGLAMGGNNKAIRNDPVEEYRRKRHSYQHQHQQSNTHLVPKTNQQNSPNASERKRGDEKPNKQPRTPPSLPKTALHKSGDPKPKRSNGGQRRRCRDECANGRTSEDERSGAQATPGGMSGCRRMRDAESSRVESMEYSENDEK